MAKSKPMRASEPAAAAQATAPASEPLLSTRDVARIYGVSEDTVRRWIRKGIIAYIQVGPFRVKRIERSEADRHFRRVAGAPV